MVAKRDGRQVIEPGIFTNPTVISYSKIPGILNTNSGLQNHAFTDLRSEHAQQRDSKTRRRDQRASQKWQTDEEPQRLNEQPPARLV
jgi:hypothetical protein